MGVGGRAIDPHDGTRGDFGGDLVIGAQADELVTEEAVGNDRPWGRLQRLTVE